MRAFKPKQACHCFQQGLRSPRDVRRRIGDLEHKQAVDLLAQQFEKHCRVLTLSPGIEAHASIQHHGSAIFGKLQVAPAKEQQRYRADQGRVVQEHLRCLHLCVVQKPAVIRLHVAESSGVQSAWVQHTAVEVANTDQERPRARSLAV
eukprot:CAMPEP_0203914162 /NCGR_PEP_ID=MMETSP0359-20131031/55083_1 /ASSEMBLY_ACC=CAM_ASM_000338 /TAXON_ID=268821 /ORGANISM="Scrippsiella Hangoei, Strain SHTV-5" /LENGTH=147 /DNA_ID=CAMNT_0050840445 /DNA_START=448 /DNA_END=891 /DNA_ORIENTATION=+